MTLDVKLALLSPGYLSRATEYNSGVENRLNPFREMTSRAASNMTSYIVLPASSDIRLPGGTPVSSEMFVSALLTMIVTESPSIQMTPEIGILNGSSFNLRLPPYRC